jgi:hypothetical protein
MNSPSDPSKIAWRENLSEFLRHSNEDAIYVSRLPALLLLLRRYKAGRLTLVDLGCGPATKTIPILQEIERSGVQTRAWLVDIDDFWIDDVRNAVRRAALADVRICVPSDCLDFVQAITEPVDILLSTHMIYDGESEDRLVRCCFGTLPQGTVAIVSTESQDSSLAEIRRGIRERCGVQMPLGNLPSVRNRLRGAGLEVIDFQFQDQFLNIPAFRRPNVPRWLIDLILGRSSGELERQLYHDVIEVVADHLLTCTSGAIAIPDDVLMAWSRSGAALDSLD